MAGTTYNTLSLPAEEPAQKGSRKVALVAAVVVAACAMFMAGRVNTRPVGYTHQEVMNVGAICAEGEFIGQCIGCKSCAEYEYANGGCSFFKDTFCSYCEPIENCQREMHRCTNRIDQRCETCECFDPIDSWEDVSKEHAAAQNPQREQQGLPLFEATFSCYLGDQCRPCTPCKKGEFQIEACNPAAQTDTVCQKCTECEEDQYVESKCTYQTDTVCTMCSVCPFEETTDVQCTGHPDNIERNPELWYQIADGTWRQSVHVNGQDTQCRACKRCDDSYQFVEEVCTPIADTKCTDCTICEDGTYIGSDCVASDGPTIYGEDQVCIDCSELEEDDDTLYITAECSPTEHDDWEYGDCTECVYGEYQEKECEFSGVSGVYKMMLGDDRNCEDCTQIDNCEEQYVTCSCAGLASDPEVGECGSSCNRCEIDGFEGTKEDYWEMYHCCCNEGWLGDQCDWERREIGCDKKGNSYRERTSFRGGFYATVEAADPQYGITDDSPASFVLWCKLQCEDFSDCTAFEVRDCIADNECEVGHNTLCGLKDFKVGETYGENMNGPLTVDEIAELDEWCETNAADVDTCQAEIKHVYDHARHGDPECDSCLEDCESDRAPEACKSACHDEFVCRVHHTCYIKPTTFKTSTLDGIRTAVRR